MCGTLWAPSTMTTAPAACAREARDLLPRVLVRLRRFLGDQVDASVDVGVVGPIVAVQRLKHRQRLLRRGRRIEVDQRLPVDLPLEDRKFPPERGEVDVPLGGESLRDHTAAFRSTASVTRVRSDSAGIRSSTGSKKPAMIRRSASRLSKPRAMR